MMVKKTFFITGTDTGVGKTFVTCALLHGLNERGLASMALKPVAAGCEQTEAGLRNEDALALQQAMSLTLDYEQINPIALPTPVSPHIAARLANRRLRVDRLAAYCKGALLQSADVALIEGAGGWRVPLNEQETLADLARELAFPVVLVVGMRLGCINHALLTAEAIRRDGLHLVAWVANTLDPDLLEADAVFDSVKAGLAVPCLGRLSWQASSDSRAAAAELNEEALQKVFQLEANQVRG